MSFFEQFLGEPLDGECDGAEPLDLCGGWCGALLVLFEGADWVLFLGGCDTEEGETRGALADLWAQTRVNMTSVRIILFISRIFFSRFQSSLNKI